ncbi:MAG: DinB family protein [Chloroflexi bacterium]|nr:DinB family protein [Chloroflexota bacterium]
MENDPRALEELKALGVRAIPVTVVGDKVIVGFNRPELARALGIRYRDTSDADTRFMLEKFDLVLSAAIRATRQIPQDKLDWSSPDRRRVLREFTYHLFDRPYVAMKSYDANSYSAEDIGRYVEEAKASPDAEAIAQYGEKVRFQIREFLSRATPAMLQTAINSYFGPSTVGQLMDLGLGHSVHHLKQLYHFMRLLGIEPQSPLGEKEFEGIAVPTELF